MADQSSYKKGDKILYITPAPAVPPEVSQLQEIVGSDGAVKVISRPQITDGTHPPLSVFIWMQVPLHSPHSSSHQALLRCKDFIK
jgi:hypothetical protein